MLLFWQSDSVFSNWYNEPVKMYDLEFANSEAAFMWFKAMLFKDFDIATAIAKSKTPKEAKDLGRKIKNFDEAVWEANRERCMYDALDAKFSKNPKLRKALLDTGNKILVEASPYDKIWGIGLPPNSLLALKEENWKGLNLLGKALMKLRDQLRSSE